LTPKKRKIANIFSSSLHRFFPHKTNRTLKRRRKKKKKNTSTHVVVHATPGFFFRSR